MLHSLIKKSFPIILLLLLMYSCSVDKFIPENETLLRKVELRSDDKGVRASDYRSYIRQEPNSRWFSLLKVPLALYSLSPADTTRRRGKFFRKIGEAPVIYDSTLTEYSARTLSSALFASGYLHASVSVDTTMRGRKTDVSYRMHPGRRYYFTDISHDFDDGEIFDLVKSAESQSAIRVGSPVDVSLLSEERSRIVSILHGQGYYKINKEFVSFIVDTLSDDGAASLTVKFAAPPGTDPKDAYRRFRYHNINISEDPPVVAGMALDTAVNKRRENGFLIMASKAERPVIEEYGHTSLRRRVYMGNVSMRPDSIYRENDFQRTYSELNRLSAVAYTSMRLTPVADSDSALLDADIRVTRNKPHAVSVELEGTNTSGDLGAAVVLSYSNRNLFRGSELFAVKLRGAYEAITGLEGYSDANYFEYGIESSLNFPYHRLPFSKRRRRLRATSSLRLMYDSQDRPEFHRRVFTGEWTYRWTSPRHPGLQHRFSPVSLNYIFMPWISSTFRHDYLDGEDARYSILRTSYENLYLMNAAYTLTYTSSLGRERSSDMLPISTAAPLSNGWQLKFHIETAGNLLYGLSNLVGASRNETGQFQFFNNVYSQYVKTEIDFAKLTLIDERNTFAFHAFFGIAVPYGNSSVIPYEKRYFAGGANSLRGWSVRTLGPGNRNHNDGKVDFVNQTGNMKLDLSLEWRTKLFWKLGGAIFIDAGNVWNTRTYPNDEGGKIDFRHLYRQIAVSYGLGLRLNFDYFVLRFDAGMKAINPAYPTGRDHFPIIHPRFSRDFAFHFAVGMPF